jgi:alpha-tubulin suppressor-like RCC1 family protein
VLTTKGEVHGWGRGTSGQLGKGIRTDVEPRKLEISTDSPVVFLFCGAHSSAVGTLDGSLHWFGQDELSTDFKIQIPLSITQKRWEKMMQWLFLSCLDKNSAFSYMPKSSSKMRVLGHFTNTTFMIRQSRQ